MRCPACDHDNRADRRFCTECGATLTAGCPSCGAACQPGEKFCGGCGGRLTAEAPARAVSTRVLEPESSLPVGERRQLTVLFCDLVNSTPLSQQLDAEDWRDVIAQYQRAVACAVGRFGGHVAKNLGDGLLVYFGWPTAREDDPERAVRAGLAIVDTLVPLNATLAANGTRLAARIGLHTGPAVIADGGEVFGETVNVAARVQGAAEPDTVAITAATQRLVAGMFVVEDRGAQTLKGVREPVTLYRVLQPSGVRSRLDVAAGRLTRFVGREVELATLVDRWERAQDGEGQNVLVFGEAGVGKSRLVYQLHEHLAVVPHTWLECGATPYTEGTPFHPVIALVAQGLAFTPEETATEKLGKLEIGLRALASTENVALLAEFLGLPPATRLQLSPELQRRKTIDLLAQWNLALSEVQPLVLVVEDLHWCDASTLELLGHLIAQSQTARVLLLATARPEFTPPWPARSNLTTVQLARLTMRQTRHMIATLAGTELPVDILEALVARADGVPLYVEELTKALSEPGAARGVEAIPASLADSLMARLDRLSAAKEVAQRAAVLGREFGYPLLAAMAGMDEAALRHGLARLVEAEILFARGELPAATYTFKHALIQETAYQSLLKRARQQLHARVAQVLEERFPERVTLEPEVAARHYEEAGLVVQAIPWYERAGERAAQRSAHREAISHLRRGIELLATLPPSTERDRQELRLQVKLGAPLLESRGYGDTEVERAYARARELCEIVGDAPEMFRAIWGLGVFYHARNELGTAIKMGQYLVDLAERAGDPALLISASVAVGCPQLWQAKFTTCLEWMERAIALYDREQHRGLAYVYGENPGVASRVYAAVALWHLGFPDRALRMIEDAVAVAEDAIHPFSRAYALVFNAAIHILRRERDGVRRAADVAIAFAEEQHLTFWLEIGHFYRGWALAEPQGGRTALDPIESAVARLAASGTEVGAPSLLGLFAEVYGAFGRIDDALQTIENARALADLRQTPYWNAELARVKGELLLRRDGTKAAPDAENLFRRSLETARVQEARSFELRTSVSLAGLLRRQGRTADARALLAPIYAWFTEGFATGDLVEARALLDKLR